MYLDGVQRDPREQEHHPPDPPPSPPPPLLFSDLFKCASMILFATTNPLGSFRDKSEEIYVLTSDGKQVKEEDGVE